VDPRERLKRYLEQRKELGERELVLDGMTIDEVMKIVGAAGSPGRTAEQAPVPPGDWRQALRASGVTPESIAKPAPSSDAAAATAPPPSKRYEFPRPIDAVVDVAASSEPSLEIPGSARTAAGSASAPRVDSPALGGTAGIDAPPGLVVGASARELFGTAVGSLGSLAELAGVVRGCTRCPLYATATNPVPGEGSATAELVCVGEAPGANEDATGRPFVGQSGELLTRILAAISLRREDVFICNVLKHRPPGNRNPLPDEVVACSPYLVQQLALIRPKVIVAFGTFAAQTLLATKLPIGKLRGSIHRYHGVPLIVTYHPAALLRNPAWKRPTWEDVQLARRILDNAPRA